MIGINTKWINGLSVNLGKLAYADANIACRTPSMEMTRAGHA